MAAFLLRICSTLPRVNPLSFARERCEALTGGISRRCSIALDRRSRLDVIRGTIERTAFRLAALPEDGRAQQLAIVRNAHEETLREHGHDPAVDPGKTYVDLIMKGIELLLAELSNTGQKN